MFLEANISRSVTVAASPAAVFAVLSDVPDSTAHFPTLLSLIAEKGGYTWTLAPVRMKGVSVQLVYCCRYTTGAVAGIVSWVPVAGVGNTEVTGDWRITPSGSGSRVTLTNHLQLKLSLPRLLRPFARPLLEKNNTELIEGYIANLAKTFSGEQGRLRAPMR